jgi:hypothetical protein
MSKWDERAHEVKGFCQFAFTAISVTAFLCCVAMAEVVLVMKFHKFLFSSL